MEGGDASAWQTYERLLANLKTEGYLDANVFRPLWTARSDPRASDVARRILLTDDSRFIEQCRAKGEIGQPILGNIVSPWLKIPAFRELLVRLLSDKTVIGIVLQEEIGVRYRTDQGASGLVGLKLNKDSKVLDEATFRVCDQIAIHLFRLKGCPGYNPVWKDEKRNAALKKLQGYIASIGDRIDQVLPAHELDRYERY